MCHKLDAIVWDYISNLIQDKERVKAKISKLLELYSDDEFSKEDLKAKIEEIKEREAILDNQIAEIKRELKEIDNMEAVEQEVEKLCLLYQNNISNPTFEQKRYIVRKWVKEINLLKDGRIVIKVNLPEMELPRSLSVGQMALTLHKEAKK